MTCGKKASNHAEGGVENQAAERAPVTGAAACHRQDFWFPAGYRPEASGILDKEQALNYVVETWQQPSLSVIGSGDRFPVRRIFCVGRNYVEHQKEMGGDGREQPFFFCKAAHDLVPVGAGESGTVHYPPMTSNYH